MLKTVSAGMVVAWHHPSYLNGQPDPIETALAHRGYQVTAVAQESEVLRAFSKAVPDLLLIYLQTSEKQGYKLCQSLRKLPQAAAVPIVFVGTRKGESESIRALRCGGSEYLQLPMEAEECWLRIERHLHTGELVRRLQADKVNLHQQIWSFNRILQQQEQQQVSLTEEIETLQRLAFVDSLTQVANRRSFSQKIVELWQAAHRDQQPVSLLLCDIDYFKRYNDTYGHPAGDACLKAVAAALVQGAHRHGDQVARYGGEEFAILLPDTDSPGAQRVAFSVQSELARAQVPHEASLVKPYVSLSVGVCTLVPEQPQTCEALIKGADEALYTAKLQGRDRTVANTDDGLRLVVPTYYHNYGSDTTRQALRQLASNKDMNQAASASLQTLVLTDDRLLERAPEVPALSLLPISPPDDEALPAQAV